MEQLLIYIKHRLKFIWKIIEWINGRLFRALYGARLRKILSGVLNEAGSQPFKLRELDPGDQEDLFVLIHKQSKEDLKYFQPHEFDRESISQQMKNPSFMMMGVYHNEALIGYFFLRFFVLKKCFVGRLIDKEYRRKGVGAAMNKIMYETAWQMGFRCLSTISRNNGAIMRAHKNNRDMLVIRELRNDYMLVEFLKSDTGS